MIPELKPNEIQRFYSKLRLGACGLIWTGPTNNHGYGRFEFYRNGQRRRILAHRLIYKLTNGSDPGESKMRHGCDTPSCCTPDCLEPGTQRDNILDALTRGRLNLTGLLLPQNERRAAAAQRMDLGIKRCSRCRGAKSMDSYWRNRKSADGRQRECKQCQRERRAGRRAA